MADSISYTPTTWADGADGGTPITAARLNNIEQGINNATTQVNANTKDIKTLGDSVSRFNPVAPVTKFDVGIDGESQVYIRVYYGSTKVGVTFSKKGTFEYWQDSVSQVQLFGVESMVFNSSGSVDSPYLYIAFKLEDGHEFRLVAERTSLHLDRFDNPSSGAQVWSK